MAHVSGQPGKTSMKVHPLAIPSTQTMNREAVSKIIWAWSYATLHWLETRFMKQLRSVSSAVLTGRVSRLIPTKSGRLVWQSCREHAAEL